MSDAAASTERALELSVHSVLSVQALRAGYGSNTVLHGVDFEVFHGEIVALLGLNGAGKSVTMRTIAGVVPAWGGSVTLEGRDITRLSVEERVGLGIAHVTQGRQVFPDLTVEENLRLGAYLLRKRDRGRYAPMLAEIYDRFPRLGERKSQLAGTLSGGEQAMLAVGRALISNPSLVLIDEPTAGLAPVVVDQLLESLRRVNAEGITILLVEQHVSFALELADRALIMQRGQIVYESRVDLIDSATMASALGIGRLVTKEGTTPAGTPRKRAARKPATTRKPVTKKPAAKKAAAKKSVAKKSVAKKSVAKKSVAKKSAVRKASKIDNKALPARLDRMELP